MRMVAVIAAIRAVLPSPSGGPLPPASRFSAGGDHGATKQRVLGQLGQIFDRYFGLV
jgi:hypothetical protein